MARKKKLRHWECTHCNWIGDKPRTIRLGGMYFAVCPKCDGKLKENEEWLLQVREAQKKFLEDMGLREKEEPQCAATSE